MQSIEKKNKTTSKHIQIARKFSWSSHLLEPCYQGIFKIWVLSVFEYLDIFGSLTLNTHNFVRRVENQRYYGPLHLFTKFLVEFISNCLLTPTRVNCEDVVHLSLVLHCKTNPFSLITHLQYEMQWKNRVRKYEKYYWAYAIESSKFRGVQVQSHLSHQKIVQVVQ